MSLRRSRIAWSSPRRGTSLLEVTVSLALLGVAGTGLIALMGQSASSLRQVREREIVIRRASDELARLSTYDRTQLLASTGQRFSRGWMMTVAQSAPELFDVAIADTITRAPILQTTLYRPDTSDAGSP